MKVIYGTNNRAKFDSMRAALSGLPIELLLPARLDLPAVKISESGDSPIENARIKAEAYYNAWGRPVFSCDSGLFSPGLPDGLQPGVHVRRMGGRDLTDDEMIEYYSSLARRFGPLEFRYKNAVCFIYDRLHRFESEADDLRGNSFLLVDTPHEKRVPGFPLDCLSVDIASGRYCYDMGKLQTDDISGAGGFHRFFLSALEELDEL